MNKLVDYKKKYAWFGFSFGVFLCLLIGVWALFEINRLTFFSVFLVSFAISLASAVILLPLGWAIGYFLGGLSGKGKSVDVSSYDWIKSLLKGGLVGFLVFSPVLFLGFLGLEIFIIGVPLGVIVGAIVGVVLKL